MMMLMLVITHSVLINCFEVKCHSGLDHFALDITPDGPKPQPAAGEPEPSTKQTGPVEPVSGAIATIAATPPAAANTVKDPKDTAKAGLHGKSVTSIRASWMQQLDEGALMGNRVLPVVQSLFMKELEAWMLQKTCLANSRSLGNHISPDQGLDCVLLEDGTLQPIMQRTPKRLVLNFAGRIVNVPVNNAIKLCEVWETQFYVDPRTYDCPASELFVPAWLVPLTLPEKAQKAAQIGLVTSYSSDVFHFKWTQGGAAKKVCAHGHMVAS